MTVLLTAALSVTVAVAVTATVADRMTAQPRRMSSPCPIPSGRFTRTGCLPGVSRIFCWQCGTYAVSLIREDAEAVRVSAAPIRFNKQRFRGGRDGELDYAQCGDDVLYFTENGYRLAGVLCAAYASVWELLEDGERAALNELRRHIR